MLRRLAVLPVLAMSLVPSVAEAAPFSGLSVGIGAANQSLDMDAQFDFDSSTRSASARKAGPMLDIGYGGFISHTIHVQGGIRAYRVELEANLYSDDCIKLERENTVYGQAGYVFGQNLVYGLMESGSADVMVATEDYPDRNRDVGSFAYGLGYKRAVGDHVEFFVEGLARTYDMIDIHYERGEYEGAKKDIEMTASSVTAGVMFRF